MKAAVRDYDVITNVCLGNKHISNMKVDPFKDWMHWMPHSFYVLGIPPPPKKLTSSFISLSSHEWARGGGLCDYTHHKYEGIQYTYGPQYLNLMYRISHLFQYILSKDFQKSYLGF